VDVVRHDDVAVDVKQIFLTGLFEDAGESVTSFGGAEYAAFTCAAEGDEVEVSGLVVSIQATEA
jgi:hypothetical protein